MSLKVKISIVFVSIALFIAYLFLFSPDLRKLNDLSMAFFKSDWCVVFSSKIRGKMGRKWGKITKGDALESGWIWKCSLY